MLIIGYVGDHRKDGLKARLGWGLVRLVQTGEYSTITHTEVVLAGLTPNFVEIGSASLRDGGVRLKETDLTPGHWRVFDIPGWSVQTARAWFQAHKGEEYDSRGALATVLFWMKGLANQWFCNEACGAAVGIQTPDQYTPCRFIALAMSMPGAREVTNEFFKISTVP